MKFNKLFYLLCISLCMTPATMLAQEDTELYIKDETEETSNEYPNHEIGFDVNFSASTFGGSGGLGIKYGYNLNENLVFGPSIRYQYSYYKSNGYNGNFSIYGGGAYIHGRFWNYLFAGLEFEILSTPFTNGYLSLKRSWVPTALLGFGFSHGFGENQFFRLNAGIFYDVIDHKNSPFRPGYFMRKENGTLIPVLYRIAFIFKL